LRWGAGGRPVDMFASSPVVGTIHGLPSIAVLAVTNSFPASRTPLPSFPGTVDVFPYLYDQVRSGQRGRQLERPTFCRPRQAMAAAVDRSCKYVAVLSPSVCVIHNWADGVDITRRLVTAEPGLLATRCFSTQKDALCWLTNPVHTEAVAAAAAHSYAERGQPVADDNGSTRIAVVTSSSASCLGVDSAGLAAALALARNPAVGACVFHRFVSAALAWQWLVTDAGRCLLDIVRWPPDDDASRVRSPAALTSSSIPGQPLRAAASTPGGGSASVEMATQSCASWSGGSNGGAVREPVPASRPGKRTLTPSGSLGLLVARLVAGSPGDKRSPGQLSGLPEQHVDAGPIEEIDLTGGAPAKRQRMPGVVPDHAAPAHWSSSDASDLLAAARRLVSQQGGGGIGHGLASSSGGAAAASLGRHDGQGTSSRSPLAGLDSRPPVQGHHGGTPSRRRGVVAQRPAAGGCRSTDNGSDGGSLEPDGVGPIGLLAKAGRWDRVCEQLFARVNSAFISGGPGAGKSTLLRRLYGFLRQRYTADGEVVVLAPTGTAAKTAGGMTYHSFFGFVRDYTPVRLDPSLEAARLLRTDRFKPIKTRLGQVRAILLDEVSFVGADNLGIMHELLCQSRSDASRPCLWFAFGDFLQLGPVKGAMAFTAPCWRRLFGDAFLDLPGSFRQSESGFIQAVRDARMGNYTDAVQQLVKECWVDGAKYESIRYEVLHLMPHHRGVLEHNRTCLQRLTSGTKASLFVAVDDVEEDPDRDASLPLPALGAVSAQSRKAALVDCVAPAAVPHCLQARVIINNNRRKALGVCHGSVGFISSYEADGTPVVRLDNHELPSGVDRGQAGLHDAGDTWIEVLCPPVKFTARILAYPGALAVRLQVPFVLGWATTIHMSQSLSISRAVLDLAECFEAGMVQTALSRVPTKSGLSIKSFAASRLRADQVALKMYREWRRL